jgi:membrane protein
MQGRLNIMWELVRKTFYEWDNDDAAQLAAAIAYYTIFSIPPLLIIALAIAGYFFNADTARNQLIAQLGGFIGPQTADFVKSLLENSTKSPSSLVASIVSIVVLLAGASGIFLQVQVALNTIWDVPKKQTRGLMKILKNRLLSFLMVLAIGFLLLFFLILSTIISGLMGYLNWSIQNMLVPEVINFLVLFVMITICVAMLYRVIPDKEITWTDVWLGAAVTALLFMLGRYAIGLYLAISRSGSTYGTAGSLIVLLIWIYYSAQIFLLGAEFTQVYSKKFGSRKRPEANPISIAEKTPARQGLHHEE